MKTNYDYSKFKEWLTLKKYSPHTVDTIIETTEYFMQWAAEENIEEPEQAGYNDAIGFMKSLSRRGVLQKTVANYLSHVRKFFDFLMSDGIVKENPVAFIKVQGIKRRVYYTILSEEELQQLYKDYPTTIEHEPGKNIPPQEKNILSKRRNKVMLGLLIHQGLRVEEIKAIKLQDLQLREGKITVHSQRRTAARIMSLAPHQVYELMDYVHEIREQFLEVNSNTDRLFLQWKKGENFYGLTTLLLKHLRAINNRVTTLDQVRVSVITGWLKIFDIRKVQYLAGHKYVSSTEGYKENMIDELQDDVTKYHPL